MSMLSAEADFVANAGTSTDTIIYMAFDPNSETYLWFKVFQGLKTVEIEGGFTALVHISPDGSKVLATAHFTGATNTKKFIYLNADTGALLGVAETPNCCGKLYSKDALVLTNDGAKIFYLANRGGLKTVVFHGMAFDGTTFADIGELAWFPDDTTGGIT